MDTNEKLNSWKQSEENQKNFQGWDFSYLEGKYEMAETPWDYRSFVLQYLTDEYQLLDMGTGGGELLQSFAHPKNLTAVTEGWVPNYELLRKELAPQGVNVQFVEEDDRLNFPDQSFDLVTNSHESFSIEEVARVLKPGGFFITQQVGDLNGIQLSSKLIPGFQKLSFPLHLSTVVNELKQQGFRILYANESYPTQRFFDMDGLIYYAKTIPWEFPDFSVETNFPELLALEEELERQGYIENREHRFIVVAQK
ncbi:methyltransferase [Enterococcus sp. JM4C]|uniref:class I SAM-dependent methyltransferase n=1 Tax=Candidatus Enterococcus huntleyi TaxID=1857217 RepID=UPI00137A3005|nr:class I SAM-dependent methyltransferase [Enterococcus sp. JM4C]KAF1299250.1 methyltransferase [Enterococcus sp. JM4C]